MEEVRSHAAEAPSWSKPVVDQTGLGATRYDFQLKWTPDPAQGRFGGPPPPTLRLPRLTLPTRPRISSPHSSSNWD